MDLLPALPSPPSRRFRSAAPTIALALLLWFCSRVVALGLDFKAVMPPVVTNLSPSDLDVFSSSSFSGNDVFLIMSIDNLGSTLSAPNLQLRYRVMLKKGGSPTADRIYECLSNTFQLGPGEVLPPITSKEFFNPPAGARIRKQLVLFEMSKSQLFETIMATQRIPDCIITQEMVLEQNGTPVSPPGVVTSDHTILNATSIDLVMPGGEGPELPVILDQHPQFVWNSDLPSHIYKTGLHEDAVFELQLFEAYGSESGAEVVSRIPIFKAQTTTTSFRYPAEARKLTSGKRYFWRVIGILKGFSSAAITSAPFGFIFEDQLDPEVDEIIKILQMVCTPEELAVVKQYRSSVSLRGDKGAMTKDELRAIAAKIVSGQLEKRGVQTQ